MPCLKRLTDIFRVFVTTGVSTRDWARGYKAGKTRARNEILAVVVALYFIVSLTNTPKPHNFESDSTRKV